MPRYNIDDEVEITDGFAHIGDKAKIIKVSTLDIICYKLDKFIGWWPQSQLKKVEG